MWQLVPAAAAAAAAPVPEPWAADWVSQGLTSHLIGEQSDKKLLMKSELRKEKENCYFPLNEKVHSVHNNDPLNGTWINSLLKKINVKEDLSLQRTQVS